MASSELNELCTQYRLIAMQLESAVEQEFRPWTVVRNANGTRGLYISRGLTKDRVSVRVDTVCTDWRIIETEICKDQQSWPAWIKKAKGTTDE